MTFNCSLPFVAELQRPHDSIVNMQSIFDRVSCLDRLTFSFLRLVFPIHNVGLHGIIVYRLTRSPRMVVKRMIVLFVCKLQSQCVFEYGLDNQGRSQEFDLGGYKC